MLLYDLAKLAHTHNNLCKIQLQIQFFFVPLNCHGFLAPSPTAAECFAVEEIGESPFGVVVEVVEVVEGAVEEFGLAVGF